MNVDWANFYRPSKNLDDFIVNDDIKKLMKEYIDNNTFPNSLFHGSPGIGKTTIAKIIPELIPNSSLLFINASANNGINLVRDQILSYVRCNGINGGMKFILLDEVDRVTEDAWESLRGVIDSSFEDTRFLMTCNRNNKILDPIISRLVKWDLAFEPKMILKRVISILNNEKIEYSKDDVKHIFDNIIKPNFPDIRKTLTHIEQCCLSGKYMYSCLNIKADDIKTLIQDILNYRITDLNDIKNIRSKWINNEVLFNKDYEVLAGYLFNECNNYQKMAIIAKHIVDMNKVNDREIEFTHMLINLLKLEGEQ